MPVQKCSINAYQICLIEIMLRAYCSIRSEFLQIHVVSSPNSLKVSFLLPVKPRSSCPSRLEPLARRGSNLCDNRPQFVCFSKPMQTQAFSLNQNKIKYFVLKISPKTQNSGIAHRILQSPVSKQAKKHIHPPSAIKSSSISE